MGIVRAAWPEPEVTKKLKMLWKMYMNQAETAAGSWPMAPAAAWSTVFSTLGTLGSEPPSTTRTPLAMPTTRAAPSRSAAPFWKEVAMSLVFISLSLKITPMMPDISPMIKNWAVISGI